ncbi:ABC transporter ATP-binding protein [Pseudomonas sp. MM213]|uniref:ABC transporter ATP-binding protein n=1 Tax=Pseudomonas sp. MM213 TaxID=2866807 RepID=UPI001CF54E09|nr:ABC transporter ATP-binding protein [Pseudomonas sp. MM213]UCP10715.1 ABC transporter ATP-binding protein [Pseudomonas sp. MM213]
MNAIAQHAVPHSTSLHTGALQIRGLSKAYRIEGQPFPVLQQINLDVRPGEFVSIVGASGCGKSTLLRLVVGLEDDYEGDILLDGKRVVGTSLERGIVFQDHRLFPWMTLSQNIALALKNHPLSKVEKDRLVAEHIALVNLEGFENAYPHQLSGGMAQRAAIARALINQPKVLLLDEPLGALDALTRVRLQHELQRIWVQQRCTVIMVTHDIEEALYLGDRVIVMDAHPGRIKHEIKVDLPHPRDRASTVLQGYKEQLLEELVGH